MEYIFRFEEFKYFLHALLIGYVADDCMSIYLRIILSHHQAYVVERGFGLINEYKC